jgi:hypothetical protein
MATKEVDALLSKEYITVKLDIDRGVGAEAIEKRYVEKEQGVPWFAFLSAAGTMIVNSTGPKGNVGEPNSADEVAYFKTMLQKARKHLTDADIDTLISSLNAFNKAGGK